MNANFGRMMGNGDFMWRKKVEKDWERTQRKKYLVYSLNLQRKKERNKERKNKKRREKEPIKEEKGYRKSDNLIYKINKNTETFQLNSKAIPSI